MKREDGKYTSDLGMTLSRAAVYDEDNDVIWMATTNTFYLLKLDLHTKRIEKGYKLPSCFNQNAYVYNYVTMFQSEEEIIIPRYDGKEVVIFNKADASFNNIEISQKYIENESDRCIYCGCKYKENIYLIGGSLNAIIKINRKTEEISAVYSCFGYGFFSRCYLLKENILYVPLAEESALIIGDLETDEFRKVVIGSKEDGGFVSAVLEKDGILLLTLNGEIISCDFYGNVIKRVKVCNENMYRLFNAENGNQYCFGCFAPDLWRVDCNGEVEKERIDYPYGKSFGNSQYSKYEMMVQIEHKIIFQARTNGQFFLLDMENGKVERLAVELLTDLRDEILNAKIKNNASFVENEIMSLTDMFTALLRE